MGMTMTQKILADHAGLPSVSAGQLIMANLDMVLGNDITTPVAVKEFRKIGLDKVFDINKISIVPDHFTPNKDIKSAEQVKFIKEFAREMGIVNYFEIGQMGVEHALLPEKGACCFGGRSYRCRLTYLHVWSVGGLLDGYRQYGHGGRDGYRSSLV